MLQERTKGKDTNRLSPTLSSMKYSRGENEGLEEEQREETQGPDRRDSQKMKKEKKVKINDGWIPVDKILV